MKTHHYRLKFPESDAQSGQWLATVILNQTAPNSVYASFFTDYGNWNFYWGATGCPDCRMFFNKCGESPHYFANKLIGTKEQEEFDGYETAKSVTEWMKDKRQSKADIEYEVAQFKDGTESDFDEWCSNTDVDSPYDFYCTKPSQNFTKLSELVLPALQAEILTDILHNPTTD